GRRRGPRPAADQGADILEGSAGERLPGGIDENQPAPPVEQEEGVGRLLEQGAPAEFAAGSRGPKVRTVVRPGFRLPTPDLRPPTSGPRPPTSGLMGSAQSLLTRNRTAPMAPRKAVRRTPQRSASRRMGPHWS